jgi:predicted nucleic acid-binding Zn ribbon protein
MEKPSKKRPSQKPSAVVDVLQRLFENSKSPLADGFQRWRLESHWTVIVGETLGKHSRPIQYDRGTLIVEVTNSVWLNEIRFLLDEIRTKVNQHQGSNWVQRIQLVHK